MSDILIRGMEMPKHCGECPFKFGYWFYDFYICAAQHGEKLHININTGFDDRCPLRNVQPHGDLIDKDEYRDEFMNGVYALCSDDSDNYRANAIIDLFDEAPTIIPASE